MFLSRMSDGSNTPCVYYLLISIQQFNILYSARLWDCFLFNNRFANSGTSLFQDKINMTSHRPTILFSSAGKRSDWENGTDSCSISEIAYRFKIWPTTLAGAVTSRHTLPRFNKALHIFCIRTLIWHSSFSLPTSNSNNRANAPERVSPTDAQRRLGFSPTGDRKKSLFFPHLPHQAF